MISQFLTEPFRDGIARDRERIPTAWLLLLLGLAVLPLLGVNLRMLALASADPSGLLAVGDWLNSHISLTWVGHDDRRVVLFILLLPMAALLVALTRLTLGIRVLGYRSILIAIGFQEIGLLPSLLLITLIAGTVLLVRPAMRRSGMPLYARVSVILCIVALTMVFGLFAGNWLGSSTLWSMAFFPVVILAMLAESIAATFAKENPAMAAWRTGNTIALAGVIALLSQVTVLRELVLACPELLISKLVLIVFVSEFLDLRLLEGFQPGSPNATRGNAKQPEVVIVRSRFGEPPLYRTTPEPPRRYQRAGLQRAIDGIRERGFGVAILEGDSSLPAKLRDLAGGGVPGEDEAPVVLNFAGGSQGAGRLAQVATICEMLGLPYSGPGPQAPALLDDRKLQLQLLTAAGLRVPRALSLKEAERLLAASDRAVWVRPRFQSDRGPITVSDIPDLRRSLHHVNQRYGQALLERIPSGRRVTAIVLAPETDQPRILPLLERTRTGRGFETLVADASGWTNECADAVSKAATAALKTLECRDLARVDLRCTAQGRVTVTRVFAIEPISSGSAAMVAMAAAGLAPGDVSTELIHAAVARWRNRICVRQTSPDAARSPIYLERAKPCVTSASSVTA